MPAELTFDMLRRAMDELRTPPSVVQRLFLGERVVEQLIAGGVLRRTEDGTVFWPRPHHLYDIEVAVTKELPDVIFGQMTDGTYFTNGGSDAFTTEADRE